MQTVINASPSSRFKPLNQQAFVTDAQQFYDSIRYHNIGLVLALRPATTKQSQIDNFIDAMALSKSIKTFGQISNELFIIFISQAVCERQNQVRAIHSTIYSFFSELKMLNPSAHHFAISGKIGVSVLGYDATSIKGATIHASQATMEQGTTAKHRVSIYDSNLSSELKRYRILEDLVATEINNNDLNIVYQPVINCHSWSIDGYEALCRFNANEVLQTNTKELIGIAEDLDMVSELDLLVYQKAFKELHSTLKKKNQFININLSPNTKTNIDKLFQYVELLADQENISPEQLIIDVNEVRNTSQRSNYETQLADVRSKGTRIALDDLSMGFSLARHLASGNYDYLRVSRKYIRNFTEQSEYYQIVKLLVGLCHRFKVKVIAEGIETLEEAQLLAYLGVDFMQGYLFSPPVPVKKLLEVEKEVQSILKRLHVNGLSAGSNDEEENDGPTVITIANKYLPRLDPGDSLLLAHEYFGSSTISVLPVIDNKQCVGIVTRELLNLHFTPAMGTEHETTREAAIWQKPVNSLMSVKFPRLDAQSQISELIYMIQEQGYQLPVILVEGTIFRGIVTERDLTRYLLKKSGLNSSGKSASSGNRKIAEDSSKTEDAYPVI